MRKYVNKIEINGSVYTHTVEANSYRDAVEINDAHKVLAARKGRKIFGRLYRND
jgi:hypothetical protein